MMLCVDSGNTRIKWSLYRASGWAPVAALPHAARAGLGATLAAYLSEQGLSAQYISELPVAISQVADAEAEQVIRSALRALGCPEPFMARSTAEACGVRNAYRQPERLGVDRWCALIGAAHAPLPSSVQPRLVVMAGTATTVDHLSADRVFRGGLILPGLDLMRRALAQDTAALPLAEGSACAYPDNTQDAIWSGCLAAQAGAIERAFAPYRADPLACCLIAGGAAPVVRSALGDLPVREDPYLVLRGVLLLARSAGR